MIIKRISALAYLCVFLIAATVGYSADEYRKLGVEDLEMATGGTGAAETATSTGGVTSTKLDATHIKLRGSPGRTIEAELATKGTGSGSSTTSLPWDNITSTDNAITPAKLQHTGTPSSTTFYRGDGAWSANDNASKLTTGTVAKTQGGFAADVSAQSGIPVFETGAISWKTFTQFLAFIGVTYNAVDNTWHFLASSRFTGNVVFDNEITATQVNTTCSYADNGCGINAANAGRIASPVAGDCGYDNTDKLWVCSPNGTDFMSGSIVPIADNVSGPSAAQSYGSWNLVTDNITVLLPTAVKGMSTCVIDNGTAHDIIVDVQATDNVILIGIVGAGGVGITNAAGSSTGDFVCLVAATNNKWYVTTKQGTWASQ